VCAQPAEDSADHRIPVDVRTIVIASLKRNELRVGDLYGYARSLLEESDVKDAEWIAQLVEHGLLRPSFVPPQEVRRLRNLTRVSAAVDGGSDRGCHSAGEAARGCSVD
jgi:hypothetical protein